MQILKQSESQSASRRVPIMMVDATDGDTAETGLTVSVSVSKNGGTLTAGGGTVTEVGSGLYYYQFTQAELDTVGFVGFVATATGARTFRGMAQVAAFAAIPSNFGSLVIDGSGRVNTNLGQGLTEDSVQASPSPTTTAFAGSSSLSSSDDRYNNAQVLFTSGALKGRSFRITDYVGSTRTLTVETMPVAPTAGDTFVIGGRATS